MPERVPSVRLEKMVKGGWNPDAPSGRPRINPRPFGIPFDPYRAAKVARIIETMPEAEGTMPPVENLRPGKVMGNWHRDTGEARHEIVPAAFGTPFAEPRLPSACACGWSPGRR
ncbi:MAG TPA: hypothetical protein VFJ82_15525 [Longimicrobium sp.]|nr:hypothetical protein [Longimicrobium sp.]